MGMNKIIRQALEDVQQQNGGLLRPEDVVKAAEDKESILHNRFTWDNTEAGKKYRLWEARQLITAVVTVLPENPKNKKVQAFVSLSTDRKTNNGYRPIGTVLSSKKLREQLLQDAHRDMQIFMDKYNSLDELEGVFEAIEETLSVVTK